MGIDIMQAGDGGGKYLAAKNLSDDWTSTVTIASVEVEEIPDRDDRDKTQKKVVLYFQGCDKGWVPNVTCRGRLKEMYGSNSDDLIGKPITLYIQPTAKMPGVWVKPNKPTGAAPKAEAPVEETLDSEIPF